LPGVLVLLDMWCVEVSMAVDWSAWEKVKRVELWEAVALSLDLEPGQVKGSTEASASGHHVGGSSGTFAKRLEVARAHLGKSTGLSGQAPGNAEITTVRLDQFRSWAESLTKPWTLPARFPGRVEQRSNHDDEFFVGWCEAEFDAKHWFSLPTLKPDAAAMVLCGFNPNETGFSEAVATKVPELSDKALLELRQLFDAEMEVTNSLRSLGVWLLLALEKGATIHPWVDRYLRLTSSNGKKPGDANQQPDFVDLSPKSKNESVSERNERWHHLLLEETPPGWGAQSRVIKRVALAEGINQWTVKKGLQEGKKLHEAKYRPQFKCGPNSAFDPSNWGTKTSR
jgi:hypothetical protein